MAPRSLFASLQAFARTCAGLPVLIVAATVVIVGILTLTRPRLQPVNGTERVWAVSAVVVKHETIQPELDLFGEVVAGRRSELRSLVTGPIARMGARFRNGGMVQQRELLLQIDPFDYETALADQRSRLKEGEI